MEVQQPKEQVDALVSVEVAVETLVKTFTLDELKTLRNLVGRLNPAAPQLPGDSAIEVAEQRAASKHGLLERVDDFLHALRTPGRHFG